MRQGQNSRSKLRLPLLSVGVAFALAGFVAACGGSDKASTTPAIVDGAKGKKVVLVSCGDVNPWCKIYNKTIVDGLTKAGATVQYLQDPFDPVLQVQNLNQAIAQKPAAILVVASSDDAIVPSLNKAKKAGVPVFNLNGRAVDASLPLLTSSILADQKALGANAAENCVKGLEEQGRSSGNIMAITGTAATNTAKDRMEAFNGVLAKYPQYKLVETQDGNWDQVLTAKLAQQIFAKYADKGGIACAYGMADYMAAGIIQAADQAGIPVGVGKKNGLIVTGSNCFKVGIDAIKAGTQYGTSTQAPGPEGAFVVETMEKYFNTGKIPATNTKEEARITSENVDEFAAECSQA